MYKRIPCVCSHCGRITGSNTVLLNDNRTSTPVRCKVCGAKSLAKILGVPINRTPRELERYKNMHGIDCVLCGTRVSHWRVHGGADVCWPCFGLLDVSMSRFVERFGVEP